MDKKHIGGDFDDFLCDEGLLDDAETVAAERVIAFHVAQQTECCDVSKAELDGLGQSKVRHRADQPKVV